MKMMHPMASEALVPIPKRRLYSPELKKQVVAETQGPGASVAGVALSHGINANIVHRWLRERAGQLPVAQSAFVALSEGSAAIKATDNFGRTDCTIRSWAVIYNHRLPQLL